MNHGLKSCDTGRAVCTLYHKSFDICNMSEAALVGHADGGESTWTMRTLP